MTEELPLVHAPDQLPLRPPKRGHLDLELQMKLAKGGCIYIHKVREYPWLRRLYRRATRRDAPEVHWNVEGIEASFKTLADAWDAKRLELLRTKESRQHVDSDTTNGGDRDDRK